MLAINMLDEAKRAGLSNDIAALAKASGIEDQGLVASRGEGIDALADAVGRALARGKAKDAIEPPAVAAAEIAAVSAAWTAALPMLTPRELRARANVALLSVGDDELRGIPLAVRTAVDAARAQAEGEGRNLDLELVGSRYQAIDAWMSRCVVKSEARIEPSPIGSTALSRIGCGARSRSSW